MKIDRLDLDKRVMIVAEIGNNHEGNAAAAAEMIRLAARAGADAVKFQTFRTEHYVAPTETARFEMLQRFELATEDWLTLKRVADGQGVVFLSTPFDLASAEMLNPLVPAFKIASGDNTFYPLIEKVASFGKPIILSAGLADLDQLRRTKTIIRAIWKAVRSEAELAILHCVVNYPVQPADTNLGFIRILQEQLACTTGYSDHTLGIEAAVYAVACGARIIEKHFTLDKKYSDFRDHQLSADPNDMKELVGRIRDLELRLGGSPKTLLSCEKALKHLVRRSIVPSRDMQKGEVIGQRDITWVRPAGGYSPGQEASVLGRRAARDIAAGVPFTEKDLV